MAIALCFFSFRDIILHQGRKKQVTWSQIMDTIPETVYTSGLFETATGDFW